MYRVNMPYYTVHSWCLDKPNIRLATDRIRLDSNALQDTCRPGHCCCCIQSSTVSSETSHSIITLMCSKTGTISNLCKIRQKNVYTQKKAKSLICVKPAKKKCLYPKPARNVDSGQCQGFIFPRASVLLITSMMKLRWIQL